MLLCDHIVFWIEHREQPKFRSRFEMLMYELDVSWSYLSFRMRYLIGTTAVRKAFNDFSKALQSHK